MKIALDAIIPNPEQPRSEIPMETLLPLADSIKTHGLINAISVEEGPNGQYILIDGERRWRAARLAGLTEIEANVRPSLNGVGQMERLILATIGNLQREDMSPVDKAKAFQKLIDIGLSQSEIAREMGVSQGYISSSLLLLRLPEYIQEKVHAGKFPSDARAVRAIMEVSEEKQHALVNAAANQHLTTKQVLTMVARAKGGIKHHAHAVAARAEVEQRQKAAGGKWKLIAIMVGNPDRFDKKTHKAAEDTCQACPLFPDASQQVCAGCSAVMLLTYLAREMQS